MKVIDVYSQYFEADCTYNGVERHRAAIRLTATSEEGSIAYEVGVSFFPHNDPEDFAVSYDARSQKCIYSAKGRRSRKKEENFMLSLRQEADLLADELGGKIFWDAPLIEARWG
ncbi:MAG: hypothetical protein IJG64_05495 [Oscillospiraceae bacterium]|nr:hypothetical protein [Oscillospiraceae bacterium]